MDLYRSIFFISLLVCIPLTLAVFSVAVDASGVGYISYMLTYYEEIGSFALFIVVMSFFLILLFFAQGESKYLFSAIFYFTFAALFYVFPTIATQTVQQTWWLSPFAYDLIWKISIAFTFLGGSYSLLKS